MADGPSADWPAAPADLASSLRLDDYLPYRLSVAANEVSRLISRAYQDRFDLTIPQWRLIAVLAEGGPMTPQDICIRTAMDKVAVSRAARDLAQTGHAEAAPHPRDGRSHLLDLTLQGRDLYARIAPLALALEAELLGGWAGTAIEGLKADLVRLQETARALGAR